MATAQNSKSQVKVAKLPPEGNVYVTATFNNTLVTITDKHGNALTWGSAGAAGFKGARKSTPFAATTAVDQVIRSSMEQGLRTVDVFIKGPGSGRDGAIRALKAAGIGIASISDVTPTPHNGCRPKKKRRV